MESKQVIERVGIISLNMNKTVFVLKNPITEELEAYIDLVTWVPGNPNVNNYCELIAKDITPWVKDNWFSISANNKFQATLAENAFENLPNTSIQFHNNWDKWLWIKK